MQASPEDAPEGARAGAGEGKDHPVPFLKEVKAFVRNLVVAEKNCELYPLEGKVVQSSLEKLLGAFLTWEEASGTSLDLQVNQFELSHGGAVVYQDEQNERNLAYCMHKDLVWALRFLPGLTVHELSTFLSCFRESRRAGDSEEDTFSSLFWEKDFQHIQVETADDLGGEEGVLEIFDIRKLEEVLDPDRFRIPAEKEVILIQQAASREQEFAAGKFNFDLSREDLERISQLKAEGENPESLGNFLDLLFEFLAAAPDPALLKDAGRAIRALFTGLVRSLDLEAARAILEGLTGRSNRDAGAPIRFWLKELLRGLWDKTTQRVIFGFLKDHPSLDPAHEVFKLMKSLDPDALPLLIEFLKIHSHRDAVIDVLVHLGKGCAELFTSYLLDPDAKLVLSLVQVLLRVEPGCAERVALAFKHPDASVRLETARILWNLKDPRAGESFLSLLDESSRECVKAALEFLSWAPCPSAFRKLAALVRSTRFDQLDKSHQRVCFQALLLADPSLGVRLISRILRPWWFDVGSDSVMRKETAILALAAVHDNPAAEALLRHTARRGRWQGQLARQALAERKRTLAGRGPDGGSGS